MQTLKPYPKVVHRRGAAPEVVQEVEPQRDLVRDAPAARVPLEDVAPVLVDARQRVPQVPVVHVVHRQDRVALRAVGRLDTVLTGTSIIHDIKCGRAVCLHEAVHCFLLHTHRCQDGNLLRHKWCTRRTVMLTLVSC